MGVASVQENVGTERRAVLLGAGVELNGAEDSSCRSWHLGWTLKDELVPTRQIWQRHPFQAKDEPAWLENLAPLGSCQWLCVLGWAPALEPRTFLSVPQGSSVKGVRLGCVQVIILHFRETPCGAVQPESFWELLQASRWGRGWGLS